MRAAVHIAVKLAEDWPLRAVHRRWVVRVASEVFLTQAHQSVELHITAHSHHHARGCVVAPHETLDALWTEMPHIALGAQDIVRQGMSLIGQFFVLVVDEFGWRVVVGIDFFQHHILLFLNLLQWESTMK